MDSTYTHILISIVCFLAINYFSGIFHTPEKMSPKYKLIYFDLPGRAEHIRYIFHYAGVEFEDVRIQKDKWPSIKKGTPFGKLPVLEIDEKQVAQSMAIGRYLAKQFDLVGKNEWEELQCDVLIDTLADVKQSITEPMRESDPIKKEEIKAKVAKEVVPFYMSKFERILKENNGFSVGSSFLLDNNDLVMTMVPICQLCDVIIKKFYLNFMTHLPMAEEWIGNVDLKITWADFVFATSLETFETMYGKSALDRYPALKGLKEKVNGLPGIKEWLENRVSAPAKP